MTNKYTEYEDAVKKDKYTVKFEWPYFRIMIKERSLLFRLPTEISVDYEEFLYCKNVAIQLMPDCDKNHLKIDYATIPMRSLYLFIVGLLRILINDDLEYIVRWFIDGGYYRLHYQSSEEILIECIDPDKCEEENVSNKKLKMFEQLKSELSDYTRRFKEALSERWSEPHESDLENICSVIKEIMEDYIQDDELSKHPEKAIPTFEKCGSLYIKDNDECLCWEQ